MVVVFLRKLLEGIFRGQGILRTREEHQQGLLEAEMLSELLEGVR